MSTRTATSPGGVGFAELCPVGQNGSAVGDPDWFKSVGGFADWVVASTRSGVVVAPMDVVVVVIIAVVELIGFVLE